MILLVLLTLTLALLILLVLLTLTLALLILLVLLTLTLALLILLVLLTLTLALLILLVLLTRTLALLILLVLLTRTLALLILLVLLTLTLALLVLLILVAHFASPSGSRVPPVEDDSARRAVSQPWLPRASQVKNSCFSGLIMNVSVSNKFLPPSYRSLLRLVQGTLVRSIACTFHGVCTLRKSAPTPVRERGLHLLRRNS